MEITFTNRFKSRWNYKKFKFLFKYQKGINPKELITSEKDSKVYLTMDYLRGNNEKLFFIEDYSNYVLVKEGEILLLWDGSNAGEFIMGKDGVLSSTMAKLFFINNNNNKYYWYVLKSMEVILKNFTIGMGIPHINSNILNNILLPIPNFEEQKLIADFLDYKTAQIDELIEQKEKLLELLEEKRIALITKAVTKGLNPDVKMKPSGIDWLGDIPEHFTISKINYEFYIKLGKMLQPEPKDENDMIKPYLRAANIFWDKIDTSDLNEMYFSPKELNDLKLQKGDLLISEGGDVGRSCICEYYFEMYYQNALIRARNLNNPKSITKYLYYWLYFLKMSGNINIICNTATISHYTAEKVKATPFIFPDLKEQEKILCYIENNLAPLKELELNINEALEKLKEYRSALITAAVTGKIDVRNFKPENKNEIKRI
ncbi:MAG: hypothetical protein FJ216_01840 [Ignavibacteria bacterium]|nr:hypothetical protein [Ignavibacteria bacterium]